MSRRHLNIAEPSHLSRREFVHRIAFGALAGAAAACSKGPPEHILPYIERPPEVIPGKPTSYASSALRSGFALGLLVETHAGRPTKIEGHPEHPSSLGATGASEQAAINSLYDADRAKSLLVGGAPSSWERVFKLLNAPSRWRRERGKGLHLLLEPSSSPFLQAELTKLREKFPEARVHFDESLAPIAEWQALERCFGVAAEPLYDLKKARLVLALDADFLCSMPNSVRLARDFARGRRPSTPGDPMSRLYVVESRLSPTGASADHRLALPNSRIAAFAYELLFRLARETKRVELPAPKESGALAHFLDALGRDLLAHPGEALVIAGERQPPETHVLAAAMNELLGAPGKTLEYQESALLHPASDSYGMEPLLSALAAREVDTLLILGANPAYSLPSDAEFARRIELARERIHLSLYENETSELCTAFVPEAHFLESWGLYRAFDGTLSLMQPAITPLYAGRTREELVAALLGNRAPDAWTLLSSYWNDSQRQTVGELGAALRRGFVPSPSAPAKLRAFDFEAVKQAFARLAPISGLELDIAPDLRIGDGRDANNPWLQELPEPMTRLVWDNAALVGPETARRHGLETGDVVELATPRGQIELPVLVQRGQAEGAVFAWHGFGRTGAESNARGVGVKLAALRTSASPWLVRDITLRRTGQRRELAIAQRADSDASRSIALSTTLAAWQRNPDFLAEHARPPASLQPNRVGGGPQWGMLIDLSACTGCASCVIACQAENNVPSVGKDEVGLGRSMHWLRIDRYYTGSDLAPEIELQPMLCQHCEKAPCEYVCPVAATVHSPDGLNEMVYNRCVGTRYCSNNCPYKVRRFNYLHYSAVHSEVEKLRNNPDVTVRGRGVMEKCTYCVQRLRRAQIDARIEQKPLESMPLQTACAQACPTGCIVFGLLSDPKSELNQRSQPTRVFNALNELGTRPRTRYLARVRNPNPELET